MIIREFEITVTLKDGGYYSLTGASAQSALAAYKNWINGANTVLNGFSFPDGSTPGNMIHLSFDCICSITQLPTEETTGPDPECDPLDCLNPTPVVPVP